MDKWDKVEETLTQAVADFLNRNAQGDTASSLQFTFETPVGDMPLCLEDDNPLFLNEVFSECSSGDEDQDDDEDISPHSVYVGLRPFERLLLIAVWYCIIFSILLFMPLMMRSLSFYLSLDQ